MKEKEYILISQKNNDFSLYKSTSLENVLKYANEISKLQEGKETVFKVLNDLQIALDVKKDIKNGSFQFFF